MDKVGILVVCYGSRGTAIVETFCRSEQFTVDLYVVDRNRNPYNVEKAKEHVVIPDLNIEAIAKFAGKYRREIDFGIIGPEKPIIAGIRDVVEGTLRIPVICPMRKYALEASKVAQRRLFQEIAPEVNPRFKVFDPKKDGSFTRVQRELGKWLDELDDQVAVKPDGTSAGKGVGIWGDHFLDRRQLYDHFLSNYRYGPVIVEEKVVGEESSFQAFCDGKHLVPLPETRDYKRAFEGDRGPNTGGMGSYKAVSDLLPFMIPQERVMEVNAIERIFRRLKGRGSNPGLRGIPFYGAFMHTGKGVKILENNSRPGDPEIQNLLPILKDDFVEVCFKMIEGDLKSVRFERQATVVTYKVPPTYSGKVQEFSGEQRIDLSKAYRLIERSGNKLKVYPGSMEQRNGETYSLTSRTVCTVGVAKDIDSARMISLEGIKAIEGGALWYRPDIASRDHVEKSIRHMERLRRT